MIASAEFKTPAAYAAPISPLEWPTTPEGVMPQAAKRSTRAICMAVQSGWENSACLRNLGSSEFKRISVSRSHHKFR